MNKCFQKTTNTQYRYIYIEDIENIPNELINNVSDLTIRRTTTFVNGEERTEVEVSVFNLSYGWEIQNTDYVVFYNTGELLNVTTQEEFRNNYWLEQPETNKITIKDSNGNVLFQEKVTAHKFNQIMDILNG